MSLQYTWNWQAEPDEDTVDRLNSSIGYSTLACRILVMRGIDTYEKARVFFKPKIQDMPSPFLMADMQKAVERIASGIEKQEKILVYGDYDVDGTTSVALMYLYLSKICNEKYLEYYIPDRNAEGYGISTEGINYAHEQGFNLIISLDCGIRSNDKIEYARSLGIDFIICDHHLPGEELPPAVAILDPKRPDCRYPYKDLSGCGVGFKLCQALNELYKLPVQDLQELTDLLAISIAADIVPITGENRFFAKLGLNELRKTKNFGLRALIPNQKLTNYGISNIVFEIAPKINAAGRIGHAKAAVELLIAKNQIDAQRIAKDIIDLNTARRELDVGSTAEAIKQVQLSQETGLITNSTIVFGDTWNKGVIGIMASRLIENFYKPTIVFTLSQPDEVVASARSVSDFNIHDALEKCSHLFSKFGGHHAAAGLSMPLENLAAFNEEFEKVVSDMILPHQKAPSLSIDTEVNLNELDKEFVNFHRKLAPFGPKNMRPNFVLRNLKLNGPVRTMGKEEVHLKFYLPSKALNKDIECVGFKLGKLAEKFRTQRFDMAFSLDENDWNGNLIPFFNIKDVRFYSDEDTTVGGEQDTTIEDEAETSDRVLA